MIAENAAVDPRQARPVLYVLSMRKGTKGRKLAPSSPMLSKCLAGSSNGAEFRKPVHWQLCV